MMYSSSLLAAATTTTISIQTKTNNDVGIPTVILALSLHAFIAIIIVASSLGGIVGFVLGRRGRNEVVGAALVVKTKKGGGGEILLSTTSFDDEQQRFPIEQNRQEDHSNKDIEEVELEELDGPTLVLRGSLKLMASQWGGGRRLPPDNNSSKCSTERSSDNNTDESDYVITHANKVVEYLSPDKMAELLFGEVAPGKKTKTRGKSGVDGVIVAGAFQTLRLDNDDADAPTASVVETQCPTSTTAQLTITTQQQQQQQQPQAFVHLLSLIQKYSVNTSHPYFFNQLFGALDPIALAAEIVALSVNTSVYTYETAPVFTLLEREVMGQIGKLVFERRCRRDRRSLECTSAQEKEAEAEKEDGEEEEEFVGEGLMIPGGSLANLTAMHAARHRWKVMNGYTRQKQQPAQKEDRNNGRHYHNHEEEKKMEDSSYHETDVVLPDTTSASSPPHLYDYTQSNLPPLPDMVALVSSEAHYSFAKSARILGLREDDLIVIPTHADGRMDVRALEKKMEELEAGDDVDDSWQEVVKGESISSSKRKRVRVPFFVACTAGSTVRGSFDEIADIVKVCREYEARGGKVGDSSSLSMQQQQTHHYQRSIWVHVDGAWGGSAIFSSRPTVRTITHMDEIRHADSFTFNPHKMLGAPQQTTAFIVRHRNALRDANAAGAKYLFDPRKNGAEYDLGDLSYTCGRRTDAVKLWALWKYYGRVGLGCRVDQKVDELALFVKEMRKRPSFALACKPWPFNVNFFYFPPRIRRLLEAREIIPRYSLDSDRVVDLHNEDNCIEDYIQIPDDIAKDLANVSVMLKLRMHEAGEMIIPYQVRHFSREMQ